MKVTTILVLLGLAAMVHAASINAIVKYNGKRLCFDGFDFLEWPEQTTAHAFEMTGKLQTDTYVLAHPNTSAILESSIVIGSSVGDALYHFHGAYGVSYFAKYDLPLVASSSNIVSPSQEIQLPNHIQEIPAIFDTSDYIAVAMVSRYLTVITLQPMSAWDSVLAIVGSGNTPGGLVYNHKNNRVYYFEADYCHWGSCQHIYEFQLTFSTKSVGQPVETFTPNYELFFNKGILSGCSIDYTHDRIWCLNHAENRLYKFNVAELNANAFFALPSLQYKKGNVVFDFTSMKAYVIATAPASPTTVDGYTVVCVDLNTGTITQQITFPGNKVVSVAMGNQDTLLLGHAKRQMSIVNVDVNPFTATLVNLTVSA